MPEPRTVALVTLGCARNEVDSEELAGRLTDDGWVVVADAADADAVLVNTCGFVEAAKKDSIDTVLQAADLRDTGRPGAVVAVGCLAERYGDTLAAVLPEADAVLSFDDYRDVGTRLDDVLAGRRLVPHTPRDRRVLLPLAPVERSGHLVALPGHGQPANHHANRPANPTAPAPAGVPADLPAGLAPASGPRTLRRRLDNSVVAPLKLASGCDRRCAFCAIPSFRGSFVSRPPADVLAEARWLAEQGVRELVLVSENSTSYGKDLGNLRLLEALLPELAAVSGVVRVRVSYLQPAEMRPSLVQVLTSTPGVAPYFDLSFQHASGPVLRRMRRFGDTERFLDLLEGVRARDPLAGVRSNVIVGFPGETAADVRELERFLTAARLDAVGVFGYSDEDGTEAEGLPGQIPSGTIARRLDRVSRLVEELTAQRTEDRAGQVVEVLVESVDVLAGTAEGRAAHQAPEVDGSVVLAGAATAVTVGDLVAARVTGSVGVDLTADVLAVSSPARDDLLLTAARG